MKLKNLISIDDLPNCNTLPPLGTMNQSELMNNQAIHQSKHQYFVHRDGGIYTFFEISADSITEVINSVIESLPKNSTFQLYRIHEKNDDRWFGSVKVQIDYSFLNQKWKLSDFKYFFINLNFFEKQFADFTQKHAVILNRILDIQGLDLSQNSQEYLMNKIFDCQFDGLNWVSKKPIKTNLSTIWTGENRYSTTLGVQALDLKIFPESFLQGFDYSICLQIVRPNENQNSDLIDLVTHHKTLLSAVSPKKKTKMLVPVKRADTLIMSKEELEADVELLKGVYFINLLIMIEEAQLDSLAEKLGKLNQTFEVNGGVIRLHSIASRDVFSSFIPGNGNFSNDYRLATMNSCKIIAQDIKGL